MRLASAPKHQQLRGAPRAPHRPRALRVRAAAPTTPIAPVEQRELGQSGLQVPIIGVGAWSWGDRSGYWGYGKEYDKSASLEAYKALIKAGLTFIDTAEVYGFGLSEEFLGEFMKEAPSDPPPLIATKYAPQPWRFTADTVPTACRASLKRLQLEKMALYIQHWPGFALNAFSNDAYIEGLARCVDQGLTQAVGVSNFNPARVAAAAKALKARGTVLSSNQVQYSLLYRKPEKNGVMEACKENGVTLVAYSPLCQGMLTGKYVPGGPKPSGPRSAIYSSKIAQIQPLIEVMRAVGKERGGKTPAQVALNWAVCKGALPIPGAKSAKQVEEIAGAAGWRLSEGEVLELEKAADKAGDFLGAPFENW
ncbi:aldo keto reductase [Raphidocelis subcapitata]|uniref:Aldo keto reductase n=1 Tax=Raphidocelis subcapitata TaxID=307507 RepID=A0A2V0PCC6_9CHLO|nr:aldo keto reductase [Raphidocelis subcapitata]|eukprot:GBF94827.1 aldo keto reductase [Raphidocelis subcapitata]